MREFYSAAYKDERGSVIAVDTGSAVTSLKYDEFGNVTVTGSAPPRFRYTGQTWLPEIGQYYYKARIYNPDLGRFMQTDPIGTEDQVNLYAYVGNDPVGRTDPSGKSWWTWLVKFVTKGGDMGATTAGAAEDIGTLASPTAGLVEKGVAALNLLSELAPVSTRDVGDAAKAIDNAITAKPSVSLETQAKNLVPLNGGKSRVTLRSERQQMSIDLTGKAHRGVPTPHTKISPRNAEAPKEQQPAYNTSERKSTTLPATQEDIRTARRYLEHEE